MSELRRTNFVRGLTTRDVSQHQQLLLFARNDPQFAVNVGLLQKPALEATVSLLVLKLQLKESGDDQTVAGLDTERIIGMGEVFELVEKNHLILKKDHERLNLLLDILALAVMLEDADADAGGKFESFVDKIQNIFFEDLVFYKILRTLLMVALERKQFLDGFQQLKVCVLVKNLHSKWKYIRMISLECLQLLLNFKPEVVELWNEVIHEDRIVSQEDRIFMACHLVETVVRRNDCKWIGRIVTSAKICELIISSCKSDDKLSRKQALSIIKNLLTSAKYFPEHFYNYIFEWCTSGTIELTKEWLRFITIVESLDEMQTHLVMPVLPLIDKLDKITNPQWKDLLFTLILKHENLAVCSWGIDYLLTKSKYGAFRQDTEELLLVAMDRIMSKRFQDYGKFKQRLVQYYSHNTNLKFKVETLCNATVKSVLLIFILEVLDNILDGSTVNKLDLTVLKDRCLKHNNLNIRHLACLQLSQIILKSTIQRNISLEDALSVLFCLEGSIQTTFTQFKEWDEVKLLMDDAYFEYILKEYGSYGYPIEYTLVPCMENPKVPTELRWKRILDQDVHLAIRLLNDGNLPVLPVYLLELKPKVEAMLEDITQKKKSQIFISLASCQNIAANVHLKPLIEDVPQSLVEFLHRQLDELIHEESSNIGITVELLRLFFLLDRVDLVDMFFTASTLDKVFTNNKRRCGIYNWGRQLSELFLLRLRCSSGNVSIKNLIIDYYAELISSIYDSNDEIKTAAISNVMEMLSFSFANKMINLDDDAYYEKARTVVLECWWKSCDNSKMMSSFLATLFAPCIDGADSQKNGTIRWMNEVVTPHLQNRPLHMIVEKVFLLPIESLLAWKFFETVMFEALLFGEGRQREQRIEDGACMASNLFGTCFYKPSLKMHSDARMRVLSVIFLYRLAKTSHPDATLFLLKLEGMLVNKFLGITKSKERYYADSQAHRKKLRIIQALCVVFKLTGTKPYSLLEIVLYETNQPNINYLIELILADSSIETLTIINSLKNDKVKVSGVQSVFVILWLRCCKNNCLDAEYINFLLPWTMAQNFSTRLYAQITIAKLLEKFYDKPDRSEHCPYSNIYTAVISYRKTGNAEKNLEKCVKDFRFSSIFDNNNLTTLENVFHNIPKVSGMAAEDVVGTEILKECFEALQLDVINLGVAVEFNEVPDEKKEKVLLIQNSGGSDHIQRKIVPRKSFVPTEDFLADCPDLYNKQQQKKGKLNELIVVASLVNHLPNLGGLARSCEIFGVKEFIVNSLKDLESKEFQALSMTAEKWLNVTELKSFHIVDYLLEMKSKGYSICGAEQTTGSKMINRFFFPRHLILVLGHEKEGIPAHIIDHLDYIVEIPQFGMVRSLNVHVTGAIIMYEFAKLFTYGSE